MNYQRFVELMRVVAKQIGKPQVEVSSVTFNSAHRFLPTVASALGVDRQTAQAIGSWQDTPGDSREAMPAQRVMSVHYSDVKALASGQAKLRVLGEFVTACSHHPAVRSIIAGTPAHVPPGTLTWSAVGHAHMQRDTHRSTAASSSQGATPAAANDPRTDQPEDAGGKDRKHKKSKAKKDKKASKKARLA